MVPDLSLLILALAVSLDGFAAGTTYGLRKIKIPLRSILIIAACSGVMILLSMGLGEWINNFMTPALAHRIGPAILIAVGCWTVFHLMVQKREENHADSREARQILLFEIKTLGLMVQILKTPTVADVDGSGTISPLEAGLLGAALSFDAFGAGVGAALVGFSPVWTALLIAGMSSLFLRAGMRFGFQFSDARWVKRLSFVPGVILILIGIVKIL